ncbi:exopolysaccharide biosynthesis protein [Paracoccaceae bacterium Fryx2]|nr:exopolysaccharide biosynthesis protein [Paracoccaceae bacterium Fryx2]
MIADPPTPSQPVSPKAGRRRPTGPRLSEILQALANDTSRSHVTLGDLLHVMQERAFGALLLVFAFPNILPSPPGLAGVLGVPLMFLSAQMMLGRMPWLPQVISRRSFTREWFATIVGRGVPWLDRAEKMLTRRLEFMFSPAAERAIGALCLFLAVLLSLPIPLGNMLPSIALCIVGLGMLQRDGLWIFGGIAAAVVATVTVGGIAYALFLSAVFVLFGAF